MSEFEAVLTRLKLAQLLAGPTDNLDAQYLSVLDYKTNDIMTLPTDLSVRGADLRNFFFGHRCATDIPLVRWVHLYNFSLRLLLALTVKYQLHPLGVEDVIEQCPTRI